MRLGFQPSVLHQWWQKFLCASTLVERGRRALTSGHCRRPTACSAPLPCTEKGRFLLNQNICAYAEIDQRYFLSLQGASYLVPLAVGTFHRCKVRACCRADLSIPQKCGNCLGLDNSEMLLMLKVFRITSVNAAAEVPRIAWKGSREELTGVDVLNLDPFYWYFERTVQYLTWEKIISVTTTQRCF